MIGRVVMCRVVLDMDKWTKHSKNRRSSAFPRVFPHFTLITSTVFINVNMEFRMSPSMSDISQLGSIWSNSEPILDKKSPITEP